MAEPSGPPPRGSSFEHAASYLSQQPAAPSLVLFSTDGVLWQRTEPGVEAAPFPDAAGILAALRHRGQIKAGVAAPSSKPQATRTALFKLSAESFEPTILYTQLDGHLQAFTDAKQQTGVPFGQMLYFDDDVARLRAAASLGMTGQRVRSGLTLEDFRKGLDAFVGHHLEDRGL